MVPKGLRARVYAHWANGKPSEQYAHIRNLAIQVAQGDSQQLSLLEGGDE